MDEVAFQLGHSPGSPMTRRYARFLESAQRGIADRTQRVMDEMLEKVKQSWVGVPSLGVFVLALLLKHPPNFPYSLKSALNCEIESSISAASFELSELWKLGNKNTADHSL